MSNLIVASVKIIGTRPFLFHRFGPDSMPLEKQERTGVAGNDPEEWKKCFWYTKTGQLYMPSTYVFGCMKNGAVYTKRGRGSIQTAVCATLQVVEDKILFDRWFLGWPKDGVFDPSKETTPIEDDSLPVYLDIRSTVNPSTKGRNVRYRVSMSPGWQANFSLTWDKTIVSRAEMEAVLHDSGKLVGLGSGRRIGMGRFNILNFEIVE
jgi:hypothetical protein